MALTGAVRQILASNCMLGEGACWDAARRIVWFVDIKGHRLWHHDPASGASGSVLAPDQIGWALPAADGRLLCGLKDGLYLYHPERAAFGKLMDVPGEPAHNRLNDACSHPDGSVYFGSMDDGEEQNSGRFYRYAAGTITPAGLDTISITNGPAVSADGKTIYMTDTLGKCIHVAEIGTDGLPGPARLFVNTADHFPQAYPDGPVVDAEGYLWTGLWNGWALARFAPDGTLERTVELPVANVTKLVFGGPELKTVYVTTARKGLDDAALAAQPMAGSLFAFDSDVAGVAQTPVKLT